MPVLYIVFILVVDNIGHDTNICQPCIQNLYHLLIILDMIPTYGGLYQVFTLFVTLEKSNSFYIFTKCEKKINTP